MATTKSLDVTTEQTTWTTPQLRNLRAMGFDAPKAQMDVLFHLCKRSGLDPFVGQVYTKEYDGRWVVETTISGLLVLARRAADAAGHALSIGAPEWADDDGVWRDVWTCEKPPAAARVTVTRDGEPFTAVALFREFAQFDENGRLNRTWVKRPAGQLAKCSKSAALRDAYPNDLAGIYTSDEMAHNLNPTVAGTVVAQTGDDGLDDLLAEDAS